MALVRGLLRFRVLFLRPSADVRDTLHPYYGILARGLCSAAAVGEVEDEKTRSDVDVTGQWPSWSPKSRRTGAITIKLGMTQLWDGLGEPVPVTVLQVNTHT